MDRDLQRLAALLAAGNGFVTEVQYRAVTDLDSPLEGLVRRGWLEAVKCDALLEAARERLRKGGMPAHRATEGGIHAASAADKTVISPKGGPAVAAPIESGPRYTLGAEIGRGGLGRVIEATDDSIGRVVALKLALPASPGSALERFRWEARVTGRLEHPNIVPVHEMGVLPGTGESYFSMKRIVGRDLRQVVNEYHKGGSRWTLRRLVEVFRDVCLAVAYAHSKGVLHRDLKPANVMVGDFGETLVVDWGLAKAQGEASDPARGGGGKSGVDSSQVTRGSSVIRDSSSRTLDGDILGTPAYMPPEQARGRVADIDEKSDVYSLGAILYEILSARPPFEGKSHLDTLFRVVEEPPVAPSSRRPGVPPELEAVCLKALAKKKEDRWASATELGAEIESYLEGTLERERREKLADEQVEQARVSMGRWRELAAKARVTAAKAKAAREEVKPHEGPERKQAVWTLEDLAKSEDESSLQAFSSANLALASALSNVPGHAGARRLRAELHWRRFLDAEDSGDARGMALNRRLAEEFNDGSLDAPLRGDGTLAVRTRAYPCRCLVEGRDVAPAEIDVLGWHPWSGREIVPQIPEECGPPEVFLGAEPTATMRLRVHAAFCAPSDLAGAQVWAWKLEEIDRVLVPLTPPGAASGLSAPTQALDTLFGDSPYRPRGPGISLGTTPLAPRPWPMGSWILILVAPGRFPARVPFSIQRQQPQSLDITLFEPGEIPDGTLPIAAGPFRWQGDSANSYGEPGEIRDLSDEFLARYPVTCREYCEFLNAIDPVEAARRAPRESPKARTWWPCVEEKFFVPTPAWRNSVSPEVAALGSRPIYAETEWDTEWPVFAILWEDAAAYARWKSARDGRVMTLPHEDLWEKAARGPEGRAYPWGPNSESHFSNTCLSRSDKMSPSTITTFPLDESPYGVRGMGGNIQQWCLNESGRAGRRWTMIRGVSWPQSAAQARSSIRTAATKLYMNFTVGFRVAVAVRLGTRITSVPAP